MRQIEHAVEIRIDRLTAPGKLDESGLLASVTLISLKAGDPVTDGLGTACGTTLADLGIERRELTVVETDGNLSGHAASIPST